MRLWLLGILRSQFAFCSQRLLRNTPFEIDVLFPRFFDQRKARRDQAILRLSYGIYHVQEAV